MTQRLNRPCPDCDRAPDLTPSGVGRREFLKAAGIAAATAAGGVPLFATPKAAAAPTRNSPAETAVKALYETLTPEQKKAVCFPWDYQDTKNKRGLLRTHVSNNWHIVPQTINSDFFNKRQQHLIHDVYTGLLNPEWVARFDKQTRDDNNGKPWGTYQNIAIFGEPTGENFEMVLTGRHQTLRADGHSVDHVAFGGPMFYGHAVQGTEKVDHPGNVFWPQALAANKVYQMLDGRQKAAALADERPHEDDVGFGKEGPRSTGLRVKEMSADQKAELQKVLMMLVEPFRVEDREEALECLKRRGGLDNCRLTFYKDGDIGNDGVWDNWRLEGPAFVWYFRGEPHVHVWVNVADDPTLPINAKG
jgi:hypothetical protein